MGFSGGGSNILKSHTHDGTVAEDGGALDFNNITQSQSSAGDVFFSDGIHLQQLSYPAVPGGETLTAQALSTAPSWQAGGGLSTNSLSASLASGTWTTSSTTPVAVTGMSVTATGTGGLIIATTNASINNAVNKYKGTWIASGGTVSSATGVYCSSASNFTLSNTTSLSIARATQAIATYANVEGDTMQLNGGGSQGGCNLMVSEIY